MSNNLKDVTMNNQQVIFQLIYLTGEGFYGPPVLKKYTPETTCEILWDL
jgi:hypothetical protein